MQTPKEIFLELLQPDGHPERILKQYEALHMCLNDPINTYLRGNRAGAPSAGTAGAPPSAFRRMRRVLSPSIPMTSPSARM